MTQEEKTAAIQAVLDRVYDHYLVQNNPCGYDPESDMACDYRTRTGACCAVGIFLPDDAPFASLNVTGSILSVKRDFPAIYAGLPVDDMGFWTELQTAHDASVNIDLAAFRSDFRRRLWSLIRELREKYPYLHYPGSRFSGMAATA